MTKKELMMHNFSIQFKKHIQGTSKRPFPGLVNFALAVAYLFWLNLSAAFSQPGNGLIKIPRILTLVTFHVARDPALFSLPGQFQVHIGLAVAFSVLLVVSEELCLLIGVPK